MNKTSTVSRLSRRIALRRLSDQTERTEDDVRAERAAARPCRRAPRFTTHAVRGEVVRMFSADAVSSTVTP